MRLKIKRSNTIDRDSVTKLSFIFHALIVPSDEAEKRKVLPGAKASALTLHKDIKQV